MTLPNSFLESMKRLLGEEYPDWLASFEEQPSQGLRINTRKLSVKEWKQMDPFGCAPVPWTQNGFYYPEHQRPSKEVWYHAGLYYIQEPSAMAPAALLPVEPGDRVLDLCAAPGGKSTELGARLKGRGILIANDISSSRAKALLKNLELAGETQACVTSESPQRLGQVFPSFFDKILVDAPCSGEGMFRRDPELIKSWMQRGPQFYVPIQREILCEAADMLRPGGYLLYSTCTFCAEEDEMQTARLLTARPELELVPLPLFEGAAGGVRGEPVIRLFPHRIRGEGHFAALFRKKGETDGRAENSGRRVPGLDPEVERLERESDFSQWESQLSHSLDRSRIMVRDGSVYYLPREFDRSWRLRYLRTGLLLGQWKGKRFEPSQAAAMALNARQFDPVVSLDPKDERVARYLKGETIFPDSGQKLKKGWVLVCVDGFALGWAKYTGSMLKNKYCAGWRL